MTTRKERRRCPLCTTVSTDTECPDCGHGTLPFTLLLPDDYDSQTDD